MAYCSSCGTQIADGTTMCAACSQRAPGGVATATAPTAGGLTDNVAGMLAYVTIIPAIIFLVTAPYNKNRFVRFHSFQCLFFCLALIAISVAFSILTVVPFIALITIPLQMLVGLGSLIVWVLLLLKANQGQMYKLPVIGDLAEKQANAM
ncbi:MAG TPA: DUF4870 domain-containing protein [Terriglobales bacterium]